MKPLKLFWCSTPCGEQDYWAAATSRNMAIAFFAQEFGFELQSISAEEILPIPDALRAQLDANIADTSDLPRYVDTRVLAQLGVQYNENFHVFHRNGRIFRPEGAVRAHMQMDARARKKLHQAL